jgi:rhodanese-related sulfurtransferase
MSVRKLNIWVCLSLVSLTMLSGFSAASALALAQNSQSPLTTEYITVEDLKNRLSKNQALTIIDVRATSELVDSDSKIRGAFHVKLRKLKSRLALPPFKDLPRDREIVTYCACPNDEASLRAAQVLADSGFKHVRVLKGGWVAWKRAKGQIESAAAGM